MALQATHLLVALELVKPLEIVNTNAYYSGTLYPDSRFTSGVARKVTHGPDCPNDPVTAQTDFEKGWAVHLQYDENSGHMQRSFVPSDLHLTNQFDEAWAALTAAKVVEDVRSVLLLGRRLMLLEHIPAPQHGPKGEPLEKLEVHYAAVRDLYRHGAPRMSDYESFFAKFVPSRTARMTIRMAEDISQNPIRLTKATVIYDAVTKYMRDSI